MVVLLFPAHDEHKLENHDRKGCGDDLDEESYEHKRRARDQHDGSRQRQVEEVVSGSR